MIVKEQKLDNIYLKLDIFFSLQDRTSNHLKRRVQNY